MGDLEKVKDLLTEVAGLIDSHIQSMEAQGSVEKSAYSEGGATTAAGMSGQLGSPSAEVMLTGGLKRRKKVEKAETTEDDMGIITTINGQKLKLTGLTDKEKDQYLYGDTKIEKELSYANYLIEGIEALTAPELEDNFENRLEKCDLSKTSHMIKNKSGTWRRVAGRPCFICDDGMIHAGPQAFIGKKVATLRDDLRSERKKGAKKGIKKRVKKGAK